MPSQLVRFNQGDLTQKAALVCRVPGDGEDVWISGTKAVLSNTLHRQAVAKEVRMQVILEGNATEQNVHSCNQEFSVWQILNQDFRNCGANWRWFLQVCYPFGHCEIHHLAWTCCYIPQKAHSCKPYSTNVLFVFLCICFSEILYL